MRFSFNTSVDTQLTSPDRAPWFSCALEGPDLVYRYHNDCYHRSFGYKDFIGASVFNVMAEVEDQGFFDLLRQVFESGLPYSGEAPIYLDWQGRGEVSERRVGFTYSAVRDRRGCVSHIAVEGRLWRPTLDTVLDPSARAERQGVSALDDGELLSLFLREGDEPRAQALLDHYGGLRGVLAASLTTLSEMASTSAARSKKRGGLSSEAVLRLQVAGELHRRILLERLRRGPLLASSRRLHAYLRASLADRTREQFRVLFLDSRLQLIRDEVSSEGTSTFCAVYPREILRRALELSAHTLILVHNHPSGTPGPSVQDCRITERIVVAAAALAIEVQDHLIVAGDRIVSLRRFDPTCFVKPTRL